MTRVCDQYELFTYDPNKFSLEEEERLTDISHAYGLLLSHSKEKANYDHNKIPQAKVCYVDSTILYLVSIFIGRVG